MQLQQVLDTLENRPVSILGNRSFMKSAVMLPLIQKEDGLHVLFEIRALHLNSQPGEICFPGGKVDTSDDDVEATATRELCEELGLEKQMVTCYAQLDVLVTPFRGIIYPFVGEIIKPEHIRPNPDEVAKTFTVPLSHLLHTKPEVYDMNISFDAGPTFPFDKIPNKLAYNKRTHTVSEFFYYYEDYVIWGLTAKILHHFLELLKGDISTLKK
ncbi:NUDIX hydrolase [Bacillus alkalicellulosilyticus]|uniref:NUDIX hydrolase n=1 Tax=Alkalihalobacterium alkalicellulosilyticum TaxID=1912214 RepID=UPI000997DE04|nr:CoA pyrophosphatase [Bacillus alkalicellulosilyticus]